LADKAEDEQAQDEGAKTAGEAAGVPQPPRPEEAGPPPGQMVWQPPPGYDEEIMGPLVELYMKRKGLGDQTQAAMKLVGSFWRHGYDPGSALKNAASYMNNMRQLVESIPDTPETAPIRVELAGKTAMNASRMLSKAHGVEDDEDEELNKELRAVRRTALGLTMLNRAFAGAGGGEDVGSERLRALEEKVNRYEKQNELQQALAPIQQSLNTVNERMKTLEEGGGGGKARSSELDGVIKSIEGLGNRLDEFEKRYGLDQRIVQLQENLNTALTELKDIKSGKSGPTGASEGDLDRALKIVDKVEEKARSILKAGGEAEVNPWVVGISTAGSVATEVIKAFGREEPGGSQPTRPAPDRIAMQQVYAYVQRKLQQAAGGRVQLNTAEIAQSLNLTQEQVYAALQSLHAGNFLRLFQPSATTTGGNPPVESPPTEPKPTEQPRSEQSEAA